MFSSTISAACVYRLGAIAPVCPSLLTRGEKCHHPYQLGAVHDAVQEPRHGAKQLRVGLALRDILQWSKHLYFLAKREHSAAGGETD
jgi:hypothetical protein